MNELRVADEDRISFTKFVRDSVSYTAVSYTHLDVYKRQFQDKVHKKINKVSSDNEKAYGTSKRNARYSASNKDSITS